MEAESIGLVTIAIGLVLAVGAVRGTWRKVFADLGLASSGGSNSGIPGATAPVSTDPGQARITAPYSGKILCYQSFNATAFCTATEAQCAAIGGAPRPDVLGTCGPAVPEQYPNEPTQNPAGFAPMGGNSQYVYRG